MPYAHILFNHSILIMIVEFFTLFISALLGGVAVVAQRAITVGVLRFLLAFSGGYLLANTLLHLIPELFVSNVKPLYIGSYIMIGFFVQRFIETFSAGVEHGHSMKPVLCHCCIKNHRKFSFLISIVLHAILDGIILTHGHAHDHGYNHGKQGVLLGMMLHKFLETFAFMSVLRGFTALPGRSWFYLIAFSLAAPVGLWLSSYANHYILGGGGMILPAIVTGNFLYISATMFFETSPDHNLIHCTLWISLLGAGLAALVEFLL